MTADFVVCRQLVYAFGAQRLCQHFFAEVLRLAQRHGFEVMPDFGARPAGTHKGQPGRIGVGHRAGDHFDHVAYLTRLAGRAAWAREPLTALVLDHTLEQARGNADAGTAATAGYVDCHAWQFTPASFELLVLELGVLGEIDWRIDWLEPQPAMEFLVSLSRPRHAFAAIEDLQARRLELLRRMLLEMREVTEQLLDAMPATVR